jgi:predicted nucleic acid-binding protein
VIVVDASAITAFFLREEGWNRLAHHVRCAVSVDHIVKEFYNAIWRALAIRKLISHEHAKKVLQLFKEYVEKSLVLEPEERYVDKAFDIATEHGITVYDALYIAVALQRKLPLLTLDKRQGEVASKLGIAVKH